MNWLDFNPFITWLFWPMGCMAANASSCNMHHWCTRCTDWYSEVAQCCIIRRAMDGDTTVVKWSSSLSSSLFCKKTGQQGIYLFIYISVVVLNLWQMSAVHRVFRLLSIMSWLPLYLLLGIVIRLDSKETEIIYYTNSTIFLVSDRHSRRQHSCAGC